MKQKKTIAVTSVSFSNNAVLVEELEKAFPDAEIKYNKEGKKLVGKSLVDFLQGYEASIIALEKVDADAVKSLPEMKIFSKYGVGLDNLDIEAIRNSGIELGWRGGLNRRSVSELALGFMIGLARNIFFSGFPLKNGEWNKQGGFQLSGKTVGIIGFGFAGEDLARLLQPFHCNILVTDILNKHMEAECYGARQVELATLLKESDFISLHVPLTTLTEKMINKDFINKMKPGAYLVNTCRGEVINQKDLKEALQKSVSLGKPSPLSGAALDVFEVEPPDDMEFLGLPNLMVSPHIGGSAVEAILAMGRSAIYNLIEFYSKK